MRAAVLGSPVGHSLSPVLHGAAYAALGLHGWHYDAHECAEHIVLCTDGLHRVIPAQDLGRVVLGASAPDSAVRELTLSAYDRGSDDNITVALIRFGGDIVDSPAARLAAAFEVIDPTHVVRAPTTNGPSKQKPAAVPAAAAPAPNGTPRGTYTLPPEKRSSRPKGRSRRRTLRHRGWTQTQGIIIFLGFIAVIVYVALLLLVF
jgi:hypothetical protein